jgi:hypothetical protein
MNPVTKTIEPKEMYCERLNDTIVCGGSISPEDVAAPWD